MNSIQVPPDVETESSARSKLVLVPLGIAGTLGALAGLAGLFTVDPVFYMPAELGDIPLTPSPEFMAKYNAFYRNLSVGNAVVNFAFLGAGIGLLMGLFVGAASKVVGVLFSAVSGALGGAVGGAVAGALIGNASANLGRVTYFGISVDPLLQSVFFQALGWGGIGIGIGLTLALLCKGIACARQSLEASWVVSQLGYSMP